MYTYLFFDDQKLFGRDNLTRRYGQPTLTPDAVYSDGISTTPYPSCFVLPLEDGRWRLIYQGICPDYPTYPWFSAISTDGLHFVPEDTREMVKLEQRIADNQITDPLDGEIASIVKDPTAPADQRWKLLLAEYDFDAVHIHDSVYTSPDGLVWTLLEEACWNPYGTEPVGGAVYRPERGDFCIYHRHIWGERRVALTKTADWLHYTPMEYCLQADALDAPLDELYGMSVFRYEDRYIGFPHIYGENQSAANTKFTGGTMKPQLAWSPDGEHWMRSLRTSFLDGEREEIAQAAGHPCKMIFATSMWQMPDGELRILGVATQAEHGPAFRDLGGGKLHAYRLRKDGFVCLAAEGETPGTLMTRELLWQGGELQVNLRAARATLAVYVNDDPNDILGFCKPLSGYGHEDCEPFSGDDTDWTPRWRDDRGLKELTGRTLALELRLEQGEVYALRGACLPMCNTDALRWRRYGVLSLMRL